MSPTEGRTLQGPDALLKCGMKDEVWAAEHSSHNQNPGVLKDGKALWDHLSPAAPRCSPLNQGWIYRDADGAEGALLAGFAVSRAGPWMRSRAGIPGRTLLQILKPSQGSISFPEPPAPAPALRRSARTNRHPPALEGHVN